MVDLFFFQAEDGIRDVERSRGLGDVYKRQVYLLRFPIFYTTFYSRSIEIHYTPAFYILRLPFTSLRSASISLMDYLLHTFLFLC